MDPSDDDLDDSTTPAQHDRTAQSDADFEAQRQAYTAKHDTGDLYKQVYTRIGIRDEDEEVLDGITGARREKDDTAACLTAPNAPSEAPNRPDKPDKPFRLLVAAAVGELYFLRRYETCIRLVCAVRTFCDCDCDCDRGQAPTGAEPDAGSMIPSDGSGRAKSGKRDKQAATFRAALDRWEGKCRARIEAGRRQTVV